METKRITFYTFDLGKGRYMYDGDYMAECLYNHLNGSFFKEYHANEYQTLLKHIQKQERGYEGDILEDIFRNETELDYDFAKELKLFDVISSGCFTPKSDEGKAILKMIDSMSLEFVLYLRQHVKPTWLSLEFVVCHEEYSREVVGGLIKGEVSDVW